MAGRSLYSIEARHAPFGGVKVAQRSNQLPANLPLLLGRQGALLCCSGLLVPRLHCRLGLCMLEALCSFTDDFG